MMYGIDVSHHQAPASLPWGAFAQGAKFLIARNSYGLMKDTLTLEHLKRARAAGLKVGCYHFFRPSQDAQAQLDVFLHGLDAAGIGAGDIVPALDVERDPLPKPGTDVSKAWQEGVRRILSGLRDKYGNALVYITQREFNMLGAPEWLLTFPLWVAHYTAAAKPATPGNRPFTIWQHRVGPYLLDGPGGYDKAHPTLDQDRAGDLPLIGAVAPHPVPVPTHTDETDDGLEDLIDQHNQSVLSSFVDAEYERIRGEGLHGARDAIDFEKNDTDPSELAPESRS